MKSPTRCLEAKPTRQSIYFAGRHINLRAIQATAGIDHSYLSRIFAGKRTPRLPHVEKIAAALGMNRNDFLSALEFHTRTPRTSRKVLAEYAAGLI